MKNFRWIMMVFVSMFFVMSISSVAMAEPKACRGVSEKCGKAYDKEIGGKLYSCVKCTQALCRPGTDVLAGSKTTEKCISKGASKTGLMTDEPSKKGDPRVLTPRPVTEQPTKTQPKATSRRVGAQSDPARDEIADVRSAVRGKKLRDGRNFIQTTPVGLRVYAIVQKGQIVRWEMTDAKGRSLPTTIETKGGALAGLLADSKKKKRKTTCWACSTDKAGNRNCVKVTCPKNLPQ